MQSAGLLEAVICDMDRGARTTTSDSAGSLPNAVRCATARQRPHIGLQSDSYRPSTLSDTYPVKISQTTHIGQHVLLPIASPLLSSPYRAGPTTLRLWAGVRSTEAALPWSASPRSHFLAARAPLRCNTVSRHEVSASVSEHISAKACRLLVKSSPDLGPGMYEQVSLSMPTEQVKMVHTAIKLPPEIMSIIYSHADHSSKFHLSRVSKMCHGLWGRTW